MRIAVTGSSGFVGKNLIKTFLKEHIDIIEIDFSTGIDITQFSQCKAIPHFDLMIHLAARTFIPDAYKQPREFYHTNILGTINMLELCRQYNSRFIFTSSYVYGIPKYLPIDEAHPLSANNPYTDTKIICENLCRSYHQYFGIKTIIVRPFNIYGKGQSDNFLISSIFKQAKTGNVQLQSSRPKRDYIHIIDVISAYSKMISYENSEFEIFNLGSGNSYSVKEITELINRQFNNSLKITFSENERINEVPNTVANIEKVKKILSWLPKISFKEGLENYIKEENEYFTYRD